MPKKKIILISHNFWPENFQINDVAKSLSSKFNLTVITGKPNYPVGKIFNNYNYFTIDKEQYSKKIEIIRVPIIPRGSGGAYMKILNYLSFIISTILLSPIIFHKKKFNYIFVYAPSPVIHSLIGIFLKKTKKIPLIIWLQDLWPASLVSSGQLNNRILVGYVEKVINYIYKNTDTLLIQSEAYRKVLRGKIKASKIFYIPNSILQDRPENKKKKNFNKNNLNIIYAGNIGLVQEFDSILFAAEKIQNMQLNIRFIFYGEGVMKKKLQEIIIKKGLKNFRIKEYISKKKLIPILKESDVLYVSLKNLKELKFTIPSKVQFYLSLKKPILAEVSGESAKIIKDSGSGLVSLPGKKKFLLNNILKLYKMKKEKKLNNFGLNGYKYFNKNFSFNKILNKIKKCIDQTKF